MQTKVVKKSLAAIEDLLFSAQPQQQVRGGKLVNVTGVGKSLQAFWQNLLGNTFAGTFEDGCTLVNNQQCIVSLATGTAYYWDGPLPLKVSPGTPAPSLAELGVGKYLRVELSPLSKQVREALRLSYAEVGYKLLGGSFETGDTLTSFTDVLLHETSGLAYSWDGPYPKVVIPDSTPFTTGSGSVGRWVDVSGLTLPKHSYSIPADFSTISDFAKYIAKHKFDGTLITVSIANGTYQESTLDLTFGTEWGYGRLQFVGESTAGTVLEFSGNVDGIYAPAGTSFGLAPQFPVTGGDVKPIFKNVTLSGVTRAGIDDPYKDAMGVRAFDGGVVVLDETVRVTKFSRVGVMAERKGIAFVPGVKVDTTGSDSFAASEGGYIYCPDSVADNPKGHCYIGYSGGQLYMPNCEAKNAELHTPANVGGSGLVVTGDSYAYAINLKTHHNAQRGVSIAMGSFANLSGMVENDNVLPVTVSQDSTMVAPNANIKKASGLLALLVEKGGKVFFQVASTDTFSIAGRTTVQSMGVLHAPDGKIDNSSGNSVSAINAVVDLDRTDFTGAPAVAIFAQDGAKVKCVSGSSQTTTGTTVIAQNAEVSADNFTVSGTPSNGFRAIAAGRIYAKGAVVSTAGQYGFEANGLGSFIDATGASVGNAFTGYKAIDGGQINGKASTATGTYGDAAYSPAVNTADAKLTIIVK